MSSLTYGFVIAAWLIINLDDQAQYIPFASLEACQVAEETIRKPYLARFNSQISCFLTGVVNENQGIN